MNKRLISIISLMLQAGVLMLLLTGFAKQEKQPITSLDQLAQSGVTIAVGISGAGFSRCEAGDLQ